MTRIATIMKKILGPRLIVTMVMFPLLAAKIGKTALTGWRRKPN